MSANVQQLEATKPSALDQLCVNTIRTLSIDAVQKANSGHPGAPMGLAPVAYVLWDRFLRHSPANPRWPNRDRVVLSAGHASMLLYSMLHLTGYDLPLSEIEKFRQIGSGWQLTSTRPKTRS
jgi:transketolase